MEGARVSPTRWQSVQMQQPADARELIFFLEYYQTTAYKPVKQINLTITRKMALISNKRYPW